MLVRERDVRAAFWNRDNRGTKPFKYRGKRQNDLPADIRTEWCDFVDHLQRDGQISEKLAQRVTL